MKIARNWIILIVVLLGIAAALFISGKQHRVFIDNKKVGEYTAIDVSYSISFIIFLPSSSDITIDFNGLNIKG